MHEYWSTLRHLKMMINSTLTLLLLQLLLPSTISVEGNKSSALYQLHSFRNQAYLQMIYRSMGLRFVLRCISGFALL